MMHGVGRGAFDAVARSNCTFDELSETSPLIQTREIKPVPVVPVGEEYWRHEVNFDYLVEEGVIAPE